MTGRSAAPSRQRLASRSWRDLRPQRPADNEPELRPLSDPGAVNRLAPFCLAAATAALLVVLPPVASDPAALRLASVSTALVVAFAVFAPWARWPAWCQAIPPLAYFLPLVVLRHAEGGGISGFAPLVLLPICWLALYGTRGQLRLAIAATGVALFGPILAVGAPLYPITEWRRGVLLLVMGQLAGFAIQGLVAANRRRTADLAALGRVTRALTSGADARPEVCTAARDIAGATFVLLCEPGADGVAGALAVTASAAVANPDLLRPAAHGEGSPSAETLRTGRRGYLEVDAGEGAYAHHRSGARAVLFEPIERHGRTIGVLVLGLPEARHRPTDATVYVVELLAAEIAAALDRADLVAQLASQARTDPLTKAANRRSWDEGLERELARARRTGEPLTVGLLDLDLFKLYNDAHGHAAGDVLLHDLVAALREELRTGDIIARWGGEEFALALVGCDLKDALAVATRLLSVVPSGQTVSIGLSRAVAADTPRSLIGRADLALYTAKDSGRNCVRTLTPPVTTGPLVIPARPSG